LFECINIFEFGLDLKEPCLGAKLICFVFIKLFGVATSLASLFVKFVFIILVSFLFNLVKPIE